MDRNSALEHAFKSVKWQEEEFGMEADDLYRLSYAITSSVETVAVHSLDRLHKWLWPTVSKASLGETFEIGDVRFSVVEVHPAVDREDSKIGVLVEADGRTWKLGWFDMEGREPLVAVGVRNDEHYAGYEPAANCELEDPSHYKGGLNATGDDVSEMFDLFAILRPLMPAGLLQVKDGSRNDWELDGAEFILEHDGGVGGETAADLYRMAEQYAAARVFNWARERTVEAATFLADRGEIEGQPGAIYSDGNRTAYAVETRYASRIAFYETQVPYTGFLDRYLVWADLVGGQAQVINFYALTDGEMVENMIRLMNDDALKPTVAHDYRTGTTVFAPGREGFNHIAHFATIVHEASLAAKEFEAANQGATVGRIGSNAMR